ncbi:MAG: hypothetical protein GX800_01435 [Clostridiaceae bacterium]|nr:hypothetical protein [Clostridiaceae bacterium]
MIQFKRLLSAVIAATILFTTFNAAGVQVFDVNSVIEAEDAITNNAVIHCDDKRASGGAYLKSTAAAITNSKNIKIEDFSWLINIPETSEYHVFLRAYFSSSSYDALFYCFNSDEWVKSETGSTPDGFVWVQLGSASLNKGINKLKINHSEYNGWIDALYITSGSGKPPENLEGVEPWVKSTASLYSVVSEQKSVPVIVDTGIIEAEDATICSPYVFVSNKKASGTRGIASRSEYKNVPAAGTQGHVEFKFICEKSGTYTIWLRTYAANGGQDSVFAAVNDSKYEIVNFTVADGFVWQKVLAVKIEAGVENVLRLYSREANASLDNIIITNQKVTPVGRTGNMDGKSAKPSITANYDAPPVTPPNEHPRVLFRKSDVERIKENMKKQQNLNAVAWLNERKSEPVDGIVDKYDLKMLNKIEAFAFDYAINGNKESGRIAAEAILNYLDTCDVEGSSGNFTRNAGVVIYVVSEVYDWCYDLLTGTQKNKIIDACEVFANGMEIGWPPTKQGAVVGHGSEAQLLRDMLAFAIAVYDERPDIWQVVGGRFYQEHVPVRKYFHKSHYNMQGDGYGLYRHRWDSWSHVLIKGMGAPDPYITEDLYKVSYGMLYMRRPDGQYLRDGDTYSDTNKMWTYWSDNSTSYSLASAIVADPYLKGEFAKQQKDFKGFYEDSAVMTLVINDPDVPIKSPDNLPLSRHFADPTGRSIARTGWGDGVDCNSVVAQMKIGGMNVNNHQHNDAGHFQLYYKGILASDSGVYQGLKNDRSEGGTTYGSIHFNMYMRKTIAHNSMLVYDPSEPLQNSTGPNNINDGGQRAINNGNEFSTLNGAFEHNAQVATVEKQEIDPSSPITPSYTYLKGDITNAYTSKVQEFKRSFMFLNLFDEDVPGALIVFDKVTSSNPSFKKTWLLHGLEEPVINGNQTIFARTCASKVSANACNGKMTVDTLLPKADNAVITKVGGEDGWSNVNGVDYTGYPANTQTDEGSTWRIELSPKKEADTDYFLNIMQVSDNDKEFYKQVKLIDTNLLYGAQISDRAVTFSKSGKEIDSEISIPASQAGELKYTICDVKAGSWEVTSGGATQRLNATQEGGVLSFAAAGNITAKYLEPYNELEEENSEALVLGDKEFYKYKINGYYVFNKVEPEMADGKLTVPLGPLVKYLKINSENNDGNILMNRGKITASVTKDSNLISSNSGDVTLTTAVFEKDGELMVPLRDFAELFGCTVTWDKFSNTAFVTTPPEDYTLPETGYARFASVKADPNPVDGGNVATNSIDGDDSTIWASLGKGRYVDYELDKQYSLTAAEILFNPNNSRNAVFEIQVSTDGQEFKTVYSGNSDGSLEEVGWELFDFEQPVNAKYVRYVANGSNISDWNAIKEIRFKTK